MSVSVLWRFEKEMEMFYVGIIWQLRQTHLVKLYAEESLAGFYVSIHQAASNDVLEARELF